MSPTFLPFTALSPAPSFQHTMATGGAVAEPSSVAHQPLNLAWPRKLSLALAVTDVAAITVALLIAQVWRFGIASVGPSSPVADVQYNALAAGYGAIWVVMLWSFRSQERRIIGIGATEYGRVLNSSLVAFGVLAVIALLAKADVARGYLVIALLLGTALLLLGRLGWRVVLRMLRRQGRCLTGAIIVGPRIEVDHVITQLGGNLRAGYRPIAVVVTDDDAVSAGPSEGFPRVAMSDLPTISAKTRTRAVMIAGNLPGGREQIQALGWDLEKSQVELILVSWLTDVAGPRIHLRAVEGLPMVHVDLPQYTGLHYVIKRVLDIVLSASGLLILAPALAVIAVAVRLTSEGPAIFRQPRVGVQGTLFTMLKFRSMCIDAEGRIDELRPLSNGNGVLFKMRSDPRVTRVGAFLRKHSLDELPQLWNVLIGDMSLIGPRPPLPQEVETYTGFAHRRLLIKPGITGLWQVSGRSNLSWEESIKLDLNYVENWSVIGDLSLLFRTVKAVLKRDGAY